MSFKGTGGKGVVVRNRDNEGENEGNRRNEMLRKKWRHTSKKRE